MQTDERMLIRVQQAWDGWHNAEVRLGDLDNVHWFQPERAPHALVHADISCADVVSGDIPHHCDPASAPHRLQVCVLKKHALPSVYAELARRADRHGAAHRAIVVGVDPRVSPSGAHSTTGADT